MAAVRFTEEPEEIPSTFTAEVVATQDTTVPKQAAITKEPMMLDVCWDESTWTQGILEEYAAHPLTSFIFKMTWAPLQVND